MMQSQLQQQPQAATAQVDRGVAGLRPRARSHSSDNSSAVVKKETSDNTALTR